MTIPTTVFKTAIFVSLLFLSSCQKESKSPPPAGNSVPVNAKGAQFVAIEKLAQAGNPEAQYHFGMMYNNGEGVQKDPKEAFEWFQKASDAGDALAAFKVGCYYNGQFPGVVPIDQGKYFEYSLVAAKAGYSLAQGEIGNVYFQQGNTDEAIKWWKLAAAQGYPNALYNLSVAYDDGKVVPKDKALTYSYFKLAKLVSERQISPNAQSTLDELAGALTKDELTKAEQTVAEWKAQPTLLTQKAMNGIEEANKLIKNSADAAR